MVFDTSENTRFPVPYNNTRRGRQDSPDTKTRGVVHVDFVKLCTGGGSRIFDSHLGSGASRIAAYQLGMDFVGCELDPEYFRASDEWFNRVCRGIVVDAAGNQTQQLNLFDV